MAGRPDGGEPIRAEARCDTHRHVNVEKAALCHLEGQAELRAGLDVLVEALLVVRVNVDGKAGGVMRKA